MTSGISAGALFDTVLIANRGEIACRIIATCRRLGIRTVAVYSDADRNARHVRLADEAVHIGPSAARESYLRADRLLDAARRTGAQAIHPGYGFLSENAAFAQACADAGVVFIGPKPSSIQAMGDKREAKALMQAANVPVTPGYHGDNQDPAFLQQQADEIRYPVLIKASAGGGGKGMRLVEKREDFQAALLSCQREAESSFGDARVLIERYIVRPRHVEMQVFGDSHGNVVHLFERDCSVQRRHQKVLEEAPAPELGDAQREAMAQAAVAAARAVDYVGAGTIEFIVGEGGPDAGSGDGTGNFHFMEMNTRLQVEHPVTELVTGIDLVEWQLRVAAGQALPLRQDQIRHRGHAIEARLYAEDALKGFLPSTGTLQVMQFPEASAHVRIDTGVEQGDAISPWYDPMIAKLIVWDEDRPRALQRLRQTIDAVRVVGVTTNAVFLGRLARQADFSAARLDTGLVAREIDTLLAPLPGADDAAWMLAALGLWAQTRASSAGEDTSPWALRDGWRIGASAPRYIELSAGGETRRLALQPRADRVEIGFDGAAMQTATIAWTAPTLTAALDGVRRNVDVLVQGTQVVLYRGEDRFVFEHVDPLHRHAGAEAHAGAVIAPMPGRIVELLAPLGTPIKTGTPLLVMEAMKMEHTLQAPHDGVVKAFLARQGELVADGAVLVDFAAGDEESST
ncbi:acetyl/propionyl/methylcrotonyl-CoA carboxylase subunit alpha [Luteimonas sp. XNQY3]|nr:acetyl/propionyl/methylcrotonyl-CoA carboxylase subunit alpha [Luteimonas sp. XNQY3]MCD9006327.1 acetyl/propionyl/methylcrotonyl-CoA carboxylase subunit alpha [Luteimonas sp. XNQY3]